MPLIVGFNKKPTAESYISSDSSALISKAEKVMYLKDGDIVKISAHEPMIFNSEFSQIKRKLHDLHLKKIKSLLVLMIISCRKKFTSSQVQLFNFETIIGGAAISSNLFGKVPANLFEKVENLLILACGTSNHVG